MALTPGFVPLSKFNGAEIVPARGRYEVRIPTPGRRPVEQVDRIEEVQDPPKSKGFKWLEEQWLDHVRQSLTDARSNIRHRSGRWDDILDQKEGLLPEKGEGMLCRLGHEVNTEVFMSATTNLDELAFNQGWFKCMPPGFDPSPLGEQIADAQQQIANQQFSGATFDRNREEFKDCLLTFGIGIGTTNYEQWIQPQLINGVFSEELVDKGTVFRNVLPYHCGPRQWNQPDWHAQPGVVFQHELSIPEILAEHVTAILTEPEVDPETGKPVGGYVVPSGRYFNLGELWKRVKDQIAPGRRRLRRDSGKGAMPSDRVETGIKQVLAYTVHSRCLDMPRLVREAINRGATEAEIMLWTGLTMDRIAYCPVWELTAVDTASGTDTGSTCDLIVQVRATPYKHALVDPENPAEPGMMPFIQCGCIPFPGRALPRGLGDLMYYLQLAMNTLFTLNVDNAIRDSVDMFLIRKSAIAGLQAGDRMPLEQGLILDWDPVAVPGMKAEDIVTRWGPGANARVGVQEASMFLDRVYAAMQGMAGQVNPPWSGRKTATEISEIIRSNMSGLIEVIAKELRRAFYQLAVQTISNQQQFMTQETAMRLGGRAGLDWQLLMEARDQTGRPITSQPVNVEIIGKQRMVDRVTKGQLLTQVEMAPTTQMYFQFIGMGARPPKALHNWVFDKLRLLGMEDLERYSPEGDELTTQEIVSMLAVGKPPPKIDLSRFRTAQDWNIEMGEVRNLLEMDPNNRLAEWYLGMLQRRFREWMAINQAAAMAGANGAGQGGNGTGQPQALLPMSSGMGLPARAMTEGQAQIMNAVPTYPE